MEYNTQREHLKINDYGRNIFKLIQYVKTVEDREKRNTMANTIVNIMSRIDTDPKDGEDYNRKYWVHLMNLANWELDVDMPYEITKDETIDFKPRALSCDRENFRYRHYGLAMQQMIKKVATYPQGEERDELIRLIAHTMMRDYLLWNHDTVDSQLIRLQLEAISDGDIKLDENFEFKDFREYLKGTDDERRANGTRKKKKKKK